MILIKYKVIIGLTDEKQNAVNPFLYTGGEYVKKVILKDWYGVDGSYEIIHLKDYGSEVFSCTYLNSEGDIEKTIVSSDQLIKQDDKKEGGL